MSLIPRVSEGFEARVYALLGQVEGKVRRIYSDSKGIPRRVVSGHPCFGGWSDATEDGKVERQSNSMSCGESPGSLLAA